MLIRIIIAGGRDFTDKEYGFSELDKIFNSLNPDDSVEIISGHAKGADTIGEDYAKFKGYALTIMTADWKRYGNAAGHKRNREMADYAVLAEKRRLIAFWDGQSKGTKGMIDYANKLKIKTKIVNYNIK